MKTTPLLAALTLALGASFAGTAFAEGAEYDYPQKFVATKTRAQVQAEYLQARAQGQIVVGEVGTPPTTFVAQKTRGQVQSETLAALASGELRRTGLEFSPTGNLLPGLDQPAAVVTAGKR